MSRTRPAGEVDTCSLDGPLSGNNGDDNDYFAKDGLMTCKEDGNSMMMTLYTYMHSFVI